MNYKLVMIIQHIAVFLNQSFWTTKFIFSSDVTLCGWLGSKHQLTPLLFKICFKLGSETNLYQKIHLTVVCFFTPKH